MYVLQNADSLPADNFSNLRLTPCPQSHLSGKTKVIADIVRLSAKFHQQKFAEAAQQSNTPANSSTHLQLQGNTHPSPTLQPLDTHPEQDDMHVPPHPDLQLGVQPEMNRSLQLSPKASLVEQSLQSEEEAPTTQLLKLQQGLPSEDDILDLLQLQEGLQEVPDPQQLASSYLDLAPLNLAAEQETALAKQDIQEAAVTTIPAILPLPLVLITAKTNYACLNVALALQKSGLKPGDFKLVVSRLYMLTHKQAYTGPVKHHLTSPAELVKDIAKGKVSPLQVRFWWHITHVHHMSSLISAGFQSS